MQRLRRRHGGAPAPQALSEGRECAVSPSKAGDPCVFVFGGGSAARGAAGAGRGDVEAAGGLGALEAALAACGGRPHWGKSHAEGGAYLGAAHPGWAAFCALAEDEP